MIRPKEATLYNRSSDEAGGECTSTNKQMNEKEKEKDQEMICVTGVLTMGNTSRACSNPSECTMQSPILCFSKKYTFNYCLVFQAVCCSDHIHCCPSGHTCNVKTSTCQKGSTIIPMVKKLPAQTFEKVG